MQNSISLNPEVVVCMYNYPSQLGDEANKFRAEGNEPQIKYLQKLFTLTCCTTYSGCAPFLQLWNISWIKDQFCNCSCSDYPTTAIDSITDCPMENRKIYTSQEIGTLTAYGNLKYPRFFSYRSAEIHYTFQWIAWKLNIDTNRSCITTIEFQNGNTSFTGWIPRRLIIN